jgi:hypothetical protein
LYEFISPMHATCPSHPPWFDHPNSICLSIQIMKLLIMQFSPDFHHFLPLRSKSSVVHRGNHCLFADSFYCEIWWTPCIQCIM